jgi:hypothetical protein
VRSPALAEKNTAPANGRARATHFYPTHPRTKDMFAVQLVRDNVSSHHHHLVRRKIALLVNKKESDRNKSSW